MRTLKLYKSYNFKDKDPIIDRMRTIFEDAGISHAKAAALSGVSSSTFSNWFEGETKRPQFATVMAAARALGYDVTVVPQERKAGNVVKFTRRRVTDRTEQPRAAAH